MFIEIETWDNQRLIQTFPILNLNVISDHNRTVDPFHGSWFHRFVHNTLCVCLQKIGEDTACEEQKTNQHQHTLQQYEEQHLWTVTAETALSIVWGLLITTMSTHQKPCLLHWLAATLVSTCRLYLMQTYGMGPLDGFEEQARVRREQRKQSKLGTVHRHCIKCNRPRGHSKLPGLHHSV